jgi:hypothetical protein
MELLIRTLIATTALFSRRGNNSGGGRPLFSMITVRDKWANRHEQRANLAIHAITHTAIVNESLICNEPLHS